MQFWNFFVPVNFSNFDFENKIEIFDRFQESLHLSPARFLKLELFFIWIIIPQATNASTKILNLVLVLSLC